MAVVRSNVVIPEIFTPYIEEQVTLRSDFLQAGVVKQMAELNVTEGGDYVNVPSFDADLTGDAEVLTDNSSLVAAGITADKQRGVVLHRGKLWTSRDLAKLAAGADPMSAIGNKAAAWIANQQQKDLLASLAGCFGPLTSNSTGALRTLTVDSVSGTPAPLGPRQAAQARALLGDQGEKLAVVAMHSACYYDLVERKAIDYVTNAEARQTVSTVAAGSLDVPNAFGGSIAAAYGSVRVPMFMDYRVIVSDDLAASGGNYPCYFFAPGSVGTGTQRGLQSETDRDIAAKEDAMSVDWHNVFHPIGMQYQTSAGVNPTQAVLATAGSWTRVFEFKNIGIVRATITSNFD
jgi:hypothetical protein